MNDSQIVALYWERSEQAIAETRVKYGQYCYAIAYNILHHNEDAEESVNDTYLDAWNAMPPHKPAILSTFLGKITRRIALDRLRRNNAQKRGGGQVALSMDELTECIPDGKSIDDHLQAEELSRHIDAFLRSLPANQRSVFICRYWFFDSISDIAKQFGYSESKVKTTLHRTLGKLKNYLEKEDIFV
jgi:RNA polymerase sigma-70 factor (ECF subfamily)